MGFFDKKKVEMSAPPAPPLAPPASGLNSLNGSPSEISKPAPYLSAPAVPGRNSFEDIRSQIALQSSDSNALSVSQDEQKTNSNLELEEHNNDDALFDFSTLQLEETSVMSEPSKQVMPSFQRETINSSVDRNLSQSNNLSFVSSKGKFSKGPQMDNLFVTTTEFKTFLEIVEQVRSRVKDSSDRHLRLLDIKSEEDIEYENLRKDFQFIEDKLYEIDSLIFDR